MTETGIALHKMLPHAFPFVLIDKVMEFEAGKRVVCLKNISGNEEVINGYSPGGAIFPFLYIIEAMAQTSGLLIGSEKGGGVLSMISDAQFHRAVKPGDRLMITSELVQDFSPLFMFRVSAQVNGAPAADAGITLALTE